MPPKTDYERNPPNAAGDTPKKEEEKELHATWLERKDDAEQDRKQYLPQIKINRKFAAGKQHLNVHPKDGRVLDVRIRNGVKLVTADILTQYLLTAVGRLGSQDYRPTFMVSQDHELAEMITRQMNQAFGWGWDNEWHGDKKSLHIWRLLTIDGTCAVRARFDRRFGEVVGEVPHRDGKPIYDEEEGRNYVAEEAAAGRTAKFKTTREGKVVWEILTADNLLPPPGFDDPEDFPWEIVCRPVSIEDLKSRYGEKADDLEEEKIESSGSLTAGLGFTDEDKDYNLKGRVMTYTGYLRPCAEYPKGQVCVFTQDRVLDERDHLPITTHPNGPRTALHYFRWQILPGRFWGRAFIENGIGPQQVRNKRLTQIDAIIDRNMPKVFIEENSLARPKTGEPMEEIEIRPGAPLPKVEQGVPPGAWMLQDVKLQEENAERALGMRPITLGAPPPGVSAYSAMALLTENDSMKLDPIANDFRLEMLELCWDTMECMRNWKPQKQIMIAGPEDQLSAFLFDSNMIPPIYFVRPPRGGALPRTQASELQKINDIWMASRATPTPLPLEWYVSSLNAGKPQELPPSMVDHQSHKAELENVAMTYSLTPAPVAEYDDDVKHIEIHRAWQVPLQSLADMGDENAAQQVAVIDTHLQEHEQSAMTKQQGGAPQQGGLPPAGPATVGSPQQGFRPPPQTGGLPQLPEVSPVQGV